LLDEVQKVCTDFSVLKQGKLIYTGKVDDVTKGSTSIEVIANEPIEEILSKADFVESVNKEKEKFILRLSEGKDARDVNQLLVDQGIIVSHLNTIHKSLEKQFLEVLKESA
jgi:ABC-2 type transport system ATP-binding protein